MPLSFLRAFTPDADALLWRIAGRVDDSMLTEIAAADRELDVPENLAALRGIRDQARVPMPLGVVQEVLELTRWSDPNNPEWFPGELSPRAHWMRAFACAALLRAFGEPDKGAYLEGQNQTLIQLIDSLSQLSAGLDREAAAFLSWLLPRLAPDDDERAFFGVGLLWFALALVPQVEDDIIVELSEWIAACEHKRNTDYHGSYGLKPGRWLLSTTAFDLRHTAWEDLGAKLGRLALQGRSAAAHDWTRLIGKQLAND